MKFAAGFDCEESLLKNVEKFKFVFYALCLQQVYNQCSVDHKLYLNNRPLVLPNFLNIC